MRHGVGTKDVLHGLRLVSAAIVMAAIAPPALGQQAESSGQASKDQSVNDQMRAFEQELNTLRRENRQMRGEIDELRAAEGEQWMNEHRAEDIRAIVADVLADADTRQSLAQSGLTAGWVDGFFLSSPDGRFSLNLQGHMQVRYVQSFTSDGDSSRGGFENTRSRLTFRGHIFDRDWTYLVRNSITREEAGLVNGIGFLEDAWIRRQLNDNFSIRGGQFKLPFSREELVSSASQMAVERSLINESMSIARSQGIEFAYESDAWRTMFAVSDGGTDQLGGTLFTPAGNANPLLNSSALVQDVEWAFTGRTEWLITGSWGQFKDFTSPQGDSVGVLIGLAGHAQRDESTGAPSAGRDERYWYAYTADISAEFGGASVFASFSHHYVDRPDVAPINIMGVVLQGAVYLTPKLEVFGRLEWGEFDWDDTILERSDLNLFTLGMNYYIEGHDLKWTTDIGWATSKVEEVWARDHAGFRPDSDEGQVVIRSQFQLLF